MIWKQARAGVWIAMAIFSWTLWGHSLTASSGSDLYAGVAAYEEADYGSAERILENLDYTGLGSPERILAFKYLAMTKLAEQKQEGARLAFSRLLELDPEVTLDPKVTSPEAVRVFEEAKLDLARRFREEGVGALRLEKTNEAIELFERARGLDPLNPLLQDLINLAKDKVASLPRLPDPPPSPEPPKPEPLKLESITPSSYRVCKLALYEKAYADRGFFFSSIPSEFLGLDYLQTANEDKRNDSILRFTTSRDVVVYVAYGHRAKKLPAWLSKFTATGRSLFVDEGANSVEHVRYDIYEAKYSAGNISLGSNSLGRIQLLEAIWHQPSMYLVFFKPQ